MKKFFRVRKGTQTGLMSPVIVAALVWGGGGLTSPVAGQSSTQKPASPPAQSPRSVRAAVAGQSKSVAKAGSPGEAILRAATTLGTTAQPSQTIPTTGMRDPFKLPEPPPPSLQAGKADSKPMAARPPGARGLVIGELKLEGIVREESKNTMIAVVANNTNRAYFLREGEPVFDGVVSKITSGAVYFRENSTGEKGRVTSREVVKRLVPAPGGANETTR